MNITISLTEQEAVVLRTLLDAAVRAQGMRAAEAALVLDGKIFKALEAAQKPQETLATNGGGKDSELLARLK